MSLPRNKGIGISTYYLTQEESDSIFSNRDQIFCITLFARNIENYTLIYSYKAKEFLEIQKLKFQGGVKESEIRNNIDFFFKFDKKKDLIEQIDKEINFFDKKIEEIRKNEIITKEIDEIITNSKNALEKLIESIKALDPEIQIAIDHEGGKVNRFPWSKFDYKPNSYFGELYKKDQITAKAKFRIQALEIANELKELGIDINFAPVLDLGISNFLKKRAFSDDPEIVFQLGKIFIEELLRENIKVCLKHLPGHGRAEDTHLEICKVNEKKEILIATDLLPFKKICEIFPKEILDGKIIGMISHVMYNDIDPENIASFSKEIVQFIKNNLDPNLILISDNIAIQACLKFYKEYIEEQETNPNTKIQFSEYKEWLGAIRNEALETGINFVLYCGPEDLLKTNFFEEEFYVKK